MPWTIFAISAPPSCVEKWEGHTWKKIKRWLIERILPVWARESMQSEIDILNKKVEELKQEILRKDAYIEGLEQGIRSMRRIVINTAGGEQK